MNEPISTKEENVIVIDIRLTRGLMVAMSVALIVVAVGLYLALAGGSAQAAPQPAPVAAPSAASGSMRQYYLGYHRLGGDATTGCVSGYHMASLWEIADPSNLRYNTELGVNRPDSGSGPPSVSNGWVRTGYANDTSNVPGRANCDSWGSSLSNHYGTLAGLPPEWTSGWEDVNVWTTTVATCDSGLRVWCIED